MTVARWVKKAWDDVPEEVVKRSFKKCCLSNALDGTEDVILWENSSDDGDAGCEGEYESQEDSSDEEEDDHSEAELVEESEDED